MIFNILINNSTPYTYKNNGGLAQLGERLNGIQKVRGSNPLSSTILHKGKRQQGMSLRFVTFLIENVTITAEKIQFKW